MINQVIKTKDILLNKLRQDNFSSEPNEDIYLLVEEPDFIALIPQLPNLNMTLISLFCTEGFKGSGGFTLFYAFEKRGYSNLIFLLRQLDSHLSTSVAEYFPSACWFEREIKDGFGIEFSRAFDQRRLFLHEAYPPNFHPLRKSFKNQDITQLRKNQATTEPYRFKEVKGEGVYQVPVGPVHAGIIEPGHFRFSVIGETIFNLEIRMFYKHRGIEKLAEGKTPDQGVTIAETISGDETVANATAFCLAIENISMIAAPDRAWYLRTILLEMERIYSHLGDLAGMLVDVAFPVGASDFHILREEILRYNDILTGSRFMKGVLCPGGLKKDIPARALMIFDDYLNTFQPRFQKAYKFARTRDSVIDRLETTGVIKKELISPLNITGPAARASGANIDCRVDHPYGIYPLLEIQKRTAEKGDVLARFEVKAAEILDSTNIIQKLIREIKPGEVLTKSRIRDGYASVLVEAARGQNFHWVNIQDGLIDRYKVRTASFCNWQAIEHAVMGNIIPDFPLINKSLNLSYAGTDL